MLDKSLYHKPLFKFDFADPVILWDPMLKLYVAFGTRSHRSDGLRINIQRIFSPDLIHWSPIEEALDVASIPFKFRVCTEWWAPEVIFDDNEYRMYVSLSSRCDHGHPNSSIHLFTATELREKFVYQGQLREGPGFSTIDANPFIDPKTGKRLLYFGSDFGPISVAELSNDGKTLLAGTESICLHPRYEDGEKILIEAPHVIYLNEQGKYVPHGPVPADDDGWYIMFLSEGNTWRVGGYAVIAARSKNPTDLFLRHSEPSNILGSILGPSEKHIAPGHNALFSTAEGALYTSFHDLCPDGKCNDIDPGKIFRYPRIAPVSFEQGWPRIH